ncbi:MAG: Sulfate/thiosulfate import ATP-binding protein CysA [Pseudomonadota bacterium]
MNSRQVAEMGIARTFQNLALFKGMSVIDNIMTGRNLRIKSNLFMQALRIGPAQREEEEHRDFVEHIIDFLEIQAHRKTPVGQLPYGLQKRVDLGSSFAGRTDGRHEHGRKARHEPFHLGCERRVWNHHCAD